MFIIEDASIFFSFEAACVFPSLSIFEPMPSGICRKNRRRPLLADAFRNTVTSLHALAFPNDTRTSLPISQRRAATYAAPMTIIDITSV